MGYIDTFTISPKCQSIIIDQVQSIELEKQKNSSMWHQLWQRGIQYLSKKPRYVYAALYYGW